MDIVVQIEYKRLRQQNTPNLSKSSHLAVIPTTAVYLIYKCMSYDQPWAKSTVCLVGLLLCSVVFVAEHEFSILLS